MSWTWQGRLSPCPNESDWRTEIVHANMVTHNYSGIQFHFVIWNLGWGGGWGEEAGGQIQLRNETFTNYVTKYFWSLKFQSWALLQLSHKSLFSFSKSCWRSFYRRVFLKHYRGMYLKPSPILTLNFSKLRINKIYEISTVKTPSWLPNPKQTHTCCTK